MPPDEVAARLQRRMNRLWERWCGMGEFDGFQVEYAGPYLTDGQGVALYNVTIWGGGGFLGSERQVLVACRRHVGRRRRHRASPKASRSGHHVLGAGTHPA